MPHLKPIDLSVLQVGEDLLRAMGEWVLDQSISD